MKYLEAPTELVITETEVAGWVVVRPVGESDLANSAAFRTYLCRTLNRWRRPVVVDLSGLTYMDSSGLGALLAAYRRATQLGCQPVLAAPTAPVARLLDMTAMGHVLQVHDSVHAACRTSGA
ncbi:STAS domain-containing protein [Flindersiella endophytica]